MYDTILLRYSEIFLKSEYVKKEFEKRLIENIKLKLKGADAEILRKRHRIYIKTRDIDDAAQKIREIFGVKSLSPAAETPSNIKDLSGNTLEIAREVIKPGESFAVRVRRSRDYRLKSREVEEILGKLIQENIECRVDLDNPDKKIFVEIAGGKAYIFHRKIKAVGGLPYKTQGRLIALISQGIDSPVAAWMMMRRGCEVIALHLGEDDDEVREVIERLQDFSAHRIKIYTLPHKRILEEIYKKTGRYTCIICKRIMYRAAEKIAAQNNSFGIITGECVGQVASQTLENLMVLDEVINIPVYRPVAGMDKEDIIKIAREIGTYGLVKDKKCSFAPKKPATRADIGAIKAIEAELNINNLMDGVFAECIKK